MVTIFRFDHVIGENQHIVCTRRHVGALRRDNMAAVK